MLRVVRVRLRRRCSLYDFDAGDLELAPGEWVVVETARGQDLGRVVLPPRPLAPEEVAAELKPVLRRASGSDLQRMRKAHQKEAEALQRAQEKVDELGLSMRLVRAEYTYNRRSLTIYFTAEKRVDFRQLVRTLARSLRARIELRQVGARDEARLIGGIGPCGRTLCCETFLCDFQRISVRMAKAQGLPLNPMKISGVCGRLLCCLGYEHEQYQEIKAQLPRVGEEVVTMQGRGRVVGLQIPKEVALVEVRPGLTVEATTEELAQAAQMEAEGRLQPQPSSYVETLPLSAIPEPAPAEKGKKRRRRRKKAAVPKKPGQPAPAPPEASKKRRQGRKKGGPPAPAAAKEKRSQEKPATGEQKRRRRPRRRPGRQS